MPNPGCLRWSNAGLCLVASLALGSEFAVPLSSAGGRPLQIAASTAPCASRAGALPAPPLAPALASQPATLPAPEEPRLLRVSALGDCTLGGDRNGGATITAFDAEASRHAREPNWPWTHVLPILSADDLTLANLEGPLTLSDVPEPYGAYRFNGAPRYAQLLRAGSVEAVGFNNNHTGDFGARGVLDTVWALRRAKVGIAQEGHPFETQVRGIPVAVLVPSAGADEATLGRVSRAVAAVAKPDTVVIVYFHWGTEYLAKVERYQRDLARAVIDAGADLVLGSHPHVLQGIEEYAGRHIAYSLGNFVFGGNVNPKDRDTMIYQETFALGPNGLLSASSEFIPAVVSSTPGRNDFSPTLAEGAEAQRIRERVSAASSELAAQPLR